MFRRALTATARRTYAKVTQPAPAFAGQASVNGAFEEISLEKYNSEGTSTIDLAKFKIYWNEF